MARTLTPHQTFLAPLNKLTLRHLDLEGQAIWWEDEGWFAQDEAEEMIDAEEIGYYAEGLLAEGFGLHWQVFAESEAPNDPVLVRLFLWQTGADPQPPLPDEGWQIVAEARHPAA